MGKQGLRRILESIMDGPEIDHRTMYADRLTSKDLVGAWMGCSLAPRVEAQLPLE